MKKKGNSDDFNFPDLQGEVDDFSNLKMDQIEEMILGILKSNSSGSKKLLPMNINNLNFGVDEETINSNEEKKVKVFETIKDNINKTKKNKMRRIYGANTYGGLNNLNDLNNMSNLNMNNLNLNTINNINPMNINNLNSLITFAAQNGINLADMSENNLGALMNDLSTLENLNANGFLLGLNNNNFPNNVNLNTFNPTGFSNVNNLNPMNNLSSLNSLVGGRGLSLEAMLNLLNMTGQGTKIDSNLLTCLLLSSNGEFKEETLNAIMAANNIKPEDILQAINALSYNNANVSQGGNSSNNNLTSTASNPLSNMNGMNNSLFGGINFNNDSFGMGSVGNIPNLSNSDNLNFNSKGGFEPNKISTQLQNLQNNKPTPNSINPINNSNSSNCNKMPIQIPNLIPTPDLPAENPHESLEMMLNLFNNSSNPLLEMLNLPSDPKIPNFNNLLNPTPNALQNLLHPNEELHSLQQFSDVLKIITKDPVETYNKPEAANLNLPTHTVTKLQNEQINTKQPSLGNKESEVKLNTSENNLNLKEMNISNSSEKENVMNESESKVNVPQNNFNFDNSNNFPLINNNLLGEDFSMNMLMNFLNNPNPNGVNANNSHNAMLGLNMPPNNSSLELNNIFNVIENQMNLANPKEKSQGDSEEKTAPKPYPNYSQANLPQYDLFNNLTMSGLTGLPGNINNMSSTNPAMLNTLMNQLLLPQTGKPSGDQNLLYNFYDLLGLDSNIGNISNAQNFK